MPQTVLTTAPDTWFGYDFTVIDQAGRRVGHVDLANWRERAQLRVGDVEYQARRDGMTGPFELVEPTGLPVVTAAKPSAWRDRFTLEHRGQRYLLRRAGAWSRALVLECEGHGIVGEIRARGWTRRAWRAQLPGELPLEVQVFLLWLAVLLARRADSAAAGAAASGA